MGGAESRQVNQFLDNIVCGRDGKCAIQLKKFPKLAHCEFFKGTTNPICRATFLGHRNIVSLLLKYEADVNKQSSNGRTPLHWATFRDNTQMMQFLIDNKADTSIKDEEGNNALDLAITRINYQAARLLFNHGLELKPIEEYRGKCWREYDLELFFDSLKSGVDEVPYKSFFEKIKKAREEWLSKDLVVDRTEGWKSWMWRQMNFEEAPLIPREELPLNLQPQSSITGKVLNYMNGVDPRVPNNANNAVELKQESTQQIDVEQSQQLKDMQRNIIADQIQKVEQREKQMEEDRFREHDGESIMADDPEDLHPQQDATGADGTAINDEV